MEVVTKNMKGLLLCLLIAVPAWFLGTAFPIIGGPVIAIILGMIVTLFIKDKSSVQDGINYSAKKILQYAVILLGFGLNLSVILDTGKQSLPIIICTYPGILFKQSYAYSGTYCHFSGRRLLHMRRFRHCRHGSCY